MMIMILDLEFYFRGGQNIFTFLIVPMFPCLVKMMNKHGLKKQSKQLQIFYKYIEEHLHNLEVLGEKSKGMALSQV